MMTVCISGLVTPQTAAKKWRNLRDSYMRIKNDMYKKRSGSAASKSVKWKWFEHMQFLQDIHETQRYCNT